MPTASWASPTSTKKIPETLAGLRADAAAIFRAAIAAVDPTQLVAEHLARQQSILSPQLPLPALVVGAGKAAARMAAGCEAALGAQHLHGEVIVADGCAVHLQSITAAEAGHPLPDTRGEHATLRLIEAIRGTRSAGVLCLISGGASSLLVAPRPPVTLGDKIRTTQLLLDCGADIAEFNTVRKHLSRAKGGGLLRLAAVPMLALVISDVVGDDLGTIGSGPTVPDATTFAEAWAALQRYDLTGRVPPTVRELLKSGMEGRVPETVKPASREAGRCHSVIIGSNRTALEGAAHAARARGWAVHVQAEAVTGDTTAAAQSFAVAIREMARHRRNEQPLCILAGGETTVRVRGSGRGGRNQEFSLALAPQITDTAVVVLSAGTDGIDGPTDVAGAFVDGSSLRRARERGLDPDAALAGNDSYTFFEELGDLFRCGPTGTNVMDIKIALLQPVPGSTG